MMETCERFLRQEMSSPAQAHRIVQGGRRGLLVAAIRVGGYLTAMFPAAAKIDSAVVRVRPRPLVLGARVVLRQKSRAIQASVLCTALNYAEGRSRRIRQAIV